MVKIKRVSKGGDKKKDDNGTHDPLPGRQPSEAFMKALDAVEDMNTKPKKPKK